MNALTFNEDTDLVTMSWWVLSGSPLGLAEVMARGPVMSHRWAVTVWSGTRIIILSRVPTRSNAGPTPALGSWAFEIRFFSCNFEMFFRHFTEDFQPSLSSQSPLLTMQLMPPGYTFLMNSQSRGLNGGFAASSCSMLEIQMQIGFSAGLSWQVRKHPGEFHVKGKLCYIC